MACDAAHRPTSLGESTVRQPTALELISQCRIWRPVPSRRRPAGFTLVELLTVIAIIAVLATLLMTTLGSVKRKAREAVCTSNLHQIGLALQLYLDDFNHRPASLETLVATKYLGDRRILRCPSDRTDDRLASIPADDVKSNAITAGNATPPSHVSYTHPLNWSDTEWNRLMQFQTRAGVAVCTFHDLRPRAGNGTWDTVLTAGLILRGRLDGAVVRRHYYKAEEIAAAGNSQDRGAGNPTTSFSSNGNTEQGVALSAEPPWEFFSDEATP